MGSLTPTKMTNDIKNWINNQHAWIQEAATRLLTNGEITETDLADLVGIIKNPPTAQDPHALTPILAQE